MEAIIHGKKITVDDSERQPCEVWSRVMGYYRPVESWNIGKKQEHEDRKLFHENKTIEELDKHSQLSQVG